MGIAQWKASSIMVKATTGCLPITLGMTVHTHAPQAAGMLVIFLVASIAVTGCLLEHHTFMAILALNLGMPAQQREAGLVMVKPGRLFPVGLGVARRAVFTQGLFVLVILLVAIPTLLRQLLFVQRPCMAITAGGLTVFATQDITGIHIVVEGQVPPRLGRVAGFALGAIQAFVLVILLVATDTGRRGVLVATIAVAIVTFDLGVLIFQSKLGLLAMIKGGILPTSLAMAI